MKRHEDSETSSETAGTPFDADSLYAPIIGRLASNLSAYVVGLFMLVVLACGIYQVCARDWLNVAILFGVEAVCVALQSSAMFLVELIGEWAGGLGAFLHS